MADSNPLSNLMGGMNGSRRFLLLGAAAVAVIAVWAVSRWAGSPTYVTLYRDLELNEVSAVTEQLSKSGIASKLGAGGTEVMVPVAEIARARVALAKEGLPSNGRPGLELFDKQTWGMTDFTQRVTYQRALEGELARTIGGLRGIERAQVHLVMSTPSPLRNLERGATASVVLTLKPGTTLSNDAVQGITYIVSNSVEQLSSDNVAVMDDAGRVLSVPAGAGSIAGLTTRQLEIQRSVEQYLVGKVEELLATVVGSGRARAQVSAQLSFDQVDRTIDTFDPDGQVLKTEQKSEGGSGDPTSAAETVISNEYQNSRKLEKIVGSVGNVSKLTVAVLVDDKALRGDATRPGPGAALGIDRIETMVRNAIGVDSTRGDRVTVMAVPFEPVAAPTAEGGDSKKAGGPDITVLVERVSRPLIGLVAIVALVLLAMQALKGGGRAAAPAAPAAAPGAGAESAGPAGGNGNVAIHNRLNGEGGKPDTTAQVVRAWLAESS
jgi:flagellar M-ring protein FliF